MPTLTAHVRLRLVKLLTQAGLSHWEASAGVGKSKEFWSRRLFTAVGEEKPQPIRLSEVTALLVFLKHDAAVLLGGAPTGWAFDRLIVTRLHALITLNGHTASSADIAAGFTAGHLWQITTTKGEPLIVGKTEIPMRSLTLETVDTYLKALGVSLDALRGPVIRPIEIELLQEIALAQKQAPSQDGDAFFERRAAIRFLACMRGEFFPSRLPGTRSPNDAGMLKTSGCEIALRRLLDQEFIATRGAQNDRLLLTPSGAAILATLE